VENKIWCNDMQARSQMQCALLKLLHWAAHHILFDQPFIMILCAQASWHSVVQAAAGTCNVLMKREATSLCREEYYLCQAQGAYMLHQGCL